MGPARARRALSPLSGAPRHRGGSQGLARLKIYGERNVGTNYIEALIAQNLDVQLLGGRVSDSHLPTHLVGRLKTIFPHMDGLHESIRDRYFEDHFARDLGWKHMCPAPQRIGAQALAEVCFLCVVKNPYSWLLSLFRNPYHVGGRDVDFTSFLTRKLPVMEKRENIGPDPLTPVEVWNRKGRGYLELRAQAARCLILPYEDFLRDEAAIVARLADHFGLQRLPGHQPVVSGVKRSNRAVTREAYLDYYLKERWKDELTPENIIYINGLLDFDLVANLDYPQLDPD